MAETHESDMVGCPACRGTGHLGPDEEYDECGFCHGEGRVVNDAVTRAITEGSRGPR